MSWFKKKQDHWERQPGDIAIRIESSDVKRNWLNRPFTVWDGTVALVFAKGEMLGRITAGKHDIDGPFRKWIAGDQQTTLILVEDGDISLDLSITDLYSHENIKLDAALRLTIQLDVPSAFYLNVMKDRRRYVEQDLLSHLKPELYDALLAFASTHPINDLYHNAELREQVSRQLRDRVGRSITRLGFALVALNLVNITSDQFDPSRDAMAEVHIEGRYAAVEAARLEVLQVARESLAGDDVHKTVTKTDMLNAMREAVNKLELKDKLRADELEHLDDRLRHDAEEYNQEREQAFDKREQTHDLDMKSQRKAHGREEWTLDLRTWLEGRIARAETYLKQRELEREGDEKDWELARKQRESALDARQRKLAQDAEYERERVKSLSAADTATKIALGLGDKEALLELERMEQQKSMSPEQLLVLASEKSPAVAAALVERFKAEGKLNEELVEQLRRQMEQERQTNREHAGQLERVMNQALQQMGQVATTRSQAPAPGSQTIVTPGGHGHPTVINPQPPAPPPPPAPPASD
jgi:hypothetical protein